MLHPKLGVDRVLTAQEGSLTYVVILVMIIVLFVPCIFIFLISWFFTGRIESDRLRAVVRTGIFALTCSPVILQEAHIGFLVPVIVIFLVKNPNPALGFLTIITSWIVSLFLYALLYLILEVA